MKEGIVAPLSNYVRPARLAESDTCVMWPKKSSTRPRFIQGDVHVSISILNIHLFRHQQSAAVSFAASCRPLFRLRPANARTDLSTRLENILTHVPSCTYMLRCDDSDGGGGICFLVTRFNTIQKDLEKIHEASRHEFGCCMLRVKQWMFCQCTKPLLEISWDTCATLCYVVIGQTWGVWGAGFHEVLWWRVCAHSEGQAAAAWALQIKLALPKVTAREVNKKKPFSIFFRVFPRPAVHWFGCQGKLGGATDCP